MLHPHISALPNLYVTDFIKDMANAYAAADLVISRAGAGSISEFCLLHLSLIHIYSREILSRLGEGGRLLGFDQDEDAEQNIVNDPHLSLIHIFLSL